MRLLVTLLSDLFRLLLSLLALPLWALQRRRRFYLVFELRGDVSWRAPPRRQRWPFAGPKRPLQPPSLKKLAQRLELAQRDPRVLGVVVRVEGYEGNSAKLLAVRGMLEKLRAAGKRVAFYGRAVTMREYALMTCGDSVQLAPGGRLDLKGYAADLMVLGGTLEKLGVRAQFLRRATYKTAPELFTDKEVSPAQQETTQQMLEEAYSTAVSDIARGRNRSEEEVRKLVDGGPYSSKRALEAGLIDAIGDGEDLEIALAPPKQKQAKLRPVARYRGPSPWAWPGLRPLRRRSRVAVVKVSGTIKLGESVRLPLTPQAAGSDSIVQALRHAREDPSIRAIVLHVDSRGGSSLASELMLRAVRRAAEEKPVVAFVDHIAASGGYMALIGAQHIVSAPGGIVGSIGVFSGKFDLSALLQRLGVGTAQLKIGANSALESSLRPWTEQEKATLEAEIEEVYRDFLADVAKGRRMQVDQVEPLAGGRIYTGRRAVKLGLVDELGSFEDAVRKAAELAKLAGEPELVAIEGPARTWNALRGPKSASELLRLFLPSPVDRVFAAAEWWPRIEPKP